MRVVKLTKRGCLRVLNGEEGMTFLVASTSQAHGGQVMMHVLDFRFPDGNLGRTHQTWSLGEDDYIELEEVVEGEEDGSDFVPVPKGHDIHRELAAQLFGVPESEVTPEQRSRAKTVNFQRLHGKPL